MSQGLSELDRRSQIMQVLQWFKDDDYLLQCFLDDPDGTLEEMKGAGQEMSADAARQLKDLIFNRGGFETTYERFFTDRNDRGTPTTSAIPAPQVRGLKGKKPEVAIENNESSNDESAEEIMDEIVSKTSQEIVNLGFADEKQPAIPQEANLPLYPNHRYYFWLEIGKKIKGAIQTSDAPLPLDQLPPEAELAVVLFGFDNELLLLDDTMIGFIKIMPDSSVQVHQVAAMPEQPLSDELLTRRLFFPIQTPKETGNYRLRCHIYYQQTLIQAWLVTALVQADAEPQATAVLRANLDYSLSKSLNGHQLARMGHNRLSLLVNNNDNATHGFRFFGKAETDRPFANSTSLSEAKLQNLIDLARSALRRTAWRRKDTKKAVNEPYDPEVHEYRYDQDTISLGQLREDLARLALNGYSLYDGLVNRLADDTPESRRDAPRKVKELEAIMLQPGQVQIASKQDLRLILPAALIYDYPIRAGADNDIFELCDSFVKALDSSAPLAESACFSGNCPTREDQTIVCPSGFWGFRHSLGLPGSIQIEADAPTTIRSSTVPNLAVSFSTDEKFISRDQHFNRLKSMGFGWQDANKPETTFDLLRNGTMQLFYFFCHGGISREGVPFLSVGDKDSDWITPARLRAENINWEEDGPLIFINGCHTTAVSPEQALDLVTNFIENALAAGVIGTEITIFEPIAVTFAEACFQCFLVEGQTIGESIRRARLNLLKQRNPLGLVYIPFVIPGLKLSKG